MIQNIFNLFRRITAGICMITKGIPITGTLSNESNPYLCILIDLYVLLIGVYKVFRVAILDGCSLGRAAFTLARKSAFIASFVMGEGMPQ